MGVDVSAAPGLALELSHLRLRLRIVAEHGERLCQRAPERTDEVRLVG